MSNEVVECLIDARSLIEKEEDWCKGEYAKTDENGHMRYCALGALFHNHWGKDQWTSIEKQAETALTMAAKELYPPLSLTEANDKYGHQAALKIYDLAIQKSQQEEKGA